MSTDIHLDRAECAYAEAMALENEGMAACVDRYFETCALTVPAHGPATSCHRRTLIHQSALAKLVECGQRFKRFDPRSELAILRNGQPQIIPVVHRGFVWEPTEFERLLAVGSYSAPSLHHLYRQAGLGIPLVVTSSRQDRDPFLNDKVTFAATLNLRFADHTQPRELADWEAGTESCSIELSDPLRVHEVEFDGQPERIAKDLSAPFAYALLDRKSNILDNFLLPGQATGTTQLRMLEPYQPGKIPVVLIHGLLSDPFTWVEMVNELYAADGFVEHFQVWSFAYPTGQPFLGSATVLREQLAAARKAVDPSGSDPKLSEMVLVGHSMGGLISKLQVTYSGDQLWNSIANRPFEQVSVPPAMRDRLASSFFFDPSPHISRVVFIATPHQGSVFARRPIGKIGSNLVSEPLEMEMIHRQLIESNPGVFTNEVSERIPTSIEMLNPDSALLQTIRQLPISNRVQMHSVLGNRGWTLGYGPSDCVVPVQSARFPQASSERVISESHTQIHKHMEAIDELLAILREHLQTVSRASTESFTTRADSTPPTVEPLPAAAWYLRDG